MATILLIPSQEFTRVRQGLAPDAALPVMADMCRANALSAVKRAGSGHLGSSFSAMDLVIWLYAREMNTLRVGITDPHRDVYFSSKGHDVPGLYAVLHAYGVLPDRRLMRLRRLGGLDGHPDIGIPGIEANSGSLGMGISKGKGIALAKRLQKLGGHVFVMIGDGELQEGQNYEAFASAAQQDVGGLTVIVDHNKVQSDMLVDRIVSLGDLELKLTAFGWHVERCDGHDFAKLAEVFTRLRSVTDRPKVIIADTIKGCGVSFMQHPVALDAGGGLYPWHAGAPSDEIYARAHDELVARVNARLSAAGLSPVSLNEVVAGDRVNSAFVEAGEPVSEAAAVKSPLTDEYVAEAYGKALLDLAGRHERIVVLDADLSADCRIRECERNIPGRFVESGIAEQDMVSTAGGLARHGMLPVVNSFASFLASRANEQIYNNATERTKIIYACHYAGLIPSGPGKSHQSIRDISLLSALPNMTVLQPCNADETRMVLEYAVEEATNNCAVRLAIGPSPRKITLPADYRLRRGIGVPLTRGAHALVFAYGPVMLHEALLAAEVLAADNHAVTVVNMPWLNEIDAGWLSGIVEAFSKIFVIEDHAPVGGLGDRLIRTLSDAGLLMTGRRVDVFGIDGFPACGRPAEALRYHRLDGASLAERIRG